MQHTKKQKKVVITTRLFANTKIKDVVCVAHCILIAICKFIFFLYFSACDIKILLLIIIESVV
jgi:hypothetical protein